MDKSNIEISVHGQPLALSSYHRVVGDEYLVLLHGLQSSKELFTPFFSEKRLNDFSIIAPDFVGFGDSEKSSSSAHDVGLQVNAMCELLLSLKYKVLQKNLWVIVGCGKSPSW